MPPNRQSYQINAHHATRNCLLFVSGGFGWASRVFELPTAVAMIATLTIAGDARVTAKFAARVADIEPFRVVEVLTRAKQLASQGRDIVHMAAGEPDFATAEPIVDAAVKALRCGQTHYTPAVGIPELREAISDYYRSDYGLDISPERIVVTPGASGALLLLSALLMAPGEGMLMADPGYPCNRHFLRLVEGEGQLVAVGPQDRFQLNAALAEAAWQRNTSGVIVASPANPTGEILSRSQLQGLYELCQRRGGHLIVDEIYHGLSYNGAAPSILSITDDAFVINSFSKYFGMTGWRLGWIVAPEAAVPELEKMAQNFFISPSTVAQYAALAAFLPETRRILDRRREELVQRRDFLYPALTALGFDIPHKPEGAFYLYAGIDKFGQSTEAFCLQLLEEHGIAITPGIDFGKHNAQRHVRFAYTTSMAQLEKAVARLEALYS